MLQVEIRMKSGTGYKRVRANLQASMAQAGDSTILKKAPAFNRGLSPKS